MRCALSATVPLFLNVLQSRASVNIHARFFVFWFSMRSRKHLHVSNDSARHSSREGHCGVPWWKFVTFSCHQGARASSAPSCSTSKAFFSFSVRGTFIRQTWLCGRLVSVCGQFEGQFDVNFEIDLKTCLTWSAWRREGLHEGCVTPSHAPRQHKA